MNWEYRPENTFHTVQKRQHAKALIKAILIWTSFSITTDIMKVKAYIAHI